MTRAERAVRAAELHAKGMSRREIAVEMGISYTYAGTLLTDPDGAKDQARRDAYRGVCQMCGGPTDGSNGRAKAPKHCAVCLPNGREVYWTKERIIEAIRWWTGEHGTPPTATDFSPALARAHGKVFDERRAQRLMDEGRIPSLNTVRNAFGSWNAAIAAAGYTPVRPGHYREEVPV